MQELLDDQLAEITTLDERTRKLVKGFRLLIVIQAIAAIVSTILAWHEIETIMGTGPVGSLTGLLVFVIAFKLKDNKFYGNLYFPGVLTGLSAPVLSLSCFLVIFFLEWNQTQAYVPITSTLFIYTIFLLGFITYYLYAPKER